MRPASTNAAAIETLAAVGVAAATSTINARRGWREAPARSGAEWPAGPGPRTREGAVSLRFAQRRLWNRPVKPTSCRGAEQTSASSRRASRLDQYNAPFRTRFVLISRGANTCFAIGWFLNALPVQKRDFGGLFVNYALTRGGSPVGSSFASAERSGSKRGAWGKRSSSRAADQRRHCGEVGVGRMSSASNLRRFSARSFIFVSAGAMTFSASVASNEGRSLYPWTANTQSYFQ
jgi:hypothetical protein